MVGYDKDDIINRFREISKSTSVQKERKHFSELLNKVQVRYFKLSRL